MATKQDNANQYYVNPNELEHDYESQYNLINYNNVKDAICPFNIDPSDLNHIKFLSRLQKFVRCFFISTLPRFIKFGKFLRALYGFNNINTSVFISPIPFGKSQSNLSSIISTLESQLQEATKAKNKSKINSINQKKQEAETLRDEIATSFNKLFEVTILTSIYGKSLEELNIASDNLGLEMSKSMATIKSAWALQEDAFRANLPLCQNKLEKNNIFDTFAVSALFPFISSNISHPNGIPIGVNRHSALPILLNNFYPTLSNYNMVITGKNLCGKHAASNILISRSSVLEGVKNVILDADGKFRSVTEALGGVNINFDPHSNIIINPFDIEPEIIKDEITGKERVILNIENKIEDITNLIITMARGFTKSQYVNETTRKIIKEAIEEEYNKLGITNNPDSLFSSYGANLIGSKITRDRKQMPTLSSWYKRIQEMASFDNSIDRKYHYEYLIKYMTDFLKDSGGEISYFDGQTNIVLSEDQTFMSFDLSKLDNRFSKPLAIQALLCWLWEKYIKPNSTEKLKAEKKRLVIDELSILIPFSEATDYLNIVSQRAFEKHVSLTMISQNFNDIYNNSKLLNLLSNASIKLLMQHEPSEINSLKEVYKLTSGECTFLQHCLRGEGILKVEGNSAQIYIAPTEDEVEFMGMTGSSFLLMNDDPQE